ncbi:hypothetical protein [Cupriavidus taiwanensis]|uniref:Uncharacterized protein n=1 Tax=Cupriavidus taiwanensis TaxID=164546 RepID=A0A375J8W6_9BURK|nr:hypothetical protein [Cupriavidus taiwanensis]SPS00056.1 conserved exported hypothetical protein [Cupriavidus taiwanensis]
MFTIHRLSGVLAIVTLISWAPASLPASSAASAEHEQHHPQKPSAKSVSAAPGAAGNPALDAQVAHLRAIRERLSRASTPEERQALLAERHQVMQEAMSIMHKDMMPMGSPGGMSARKGAARKNSASAQMPMCGDMASSHMALMQEMMQAMASEPGMGSGMGMGRGGMMAPGNMMRNQPADAQR